MKAEGEGGRQAKIWFSGSLRSEKLRGEEGGDRGKGKS